MNKVKYDAVVVGAGHNGLISALYLLMAGFSVLVLEKRQNIGGASISKRVFSEFDANISVYSYLIGLFQQKIIDDLGLEFQIRKRSVGSFTPVVLGDHHDGLIVSNASPAETEDSFRRITGGNLDYKGFLELYKMTSECGSIVRPTLLKPLMAKDDFQKLFENAGAAKIWRVFFEESLGDCIEALIKNDTVRGLVFTDAKIGMLTYPDDHTLLQNLIFLYHVVGSDMAQWWVPVGGMGQLIRQLKEKIINRGGEIFVNSQVNHIEPGNKHSTVQFTASIGEVLDIDAKYVLVNADPKTLAGLLPKDSYHPGKMRDGSAFKINMLLRRLPRLKSGIPAQKVFSGTTHINEGYDQMKASYNLAAQGIIPIPVPGEMYCHTLTDDSIISPDLKSRGYHSLTYFGLDLPVRPFRYENESRRQEVLGRCLSQLDVYLKDSIYDCLAVDSSGKPCVEAKSCVDLENELSLPGGNIFHGNLSWFFDDEDAGRWGVEIPGFKNIFICGSGAKRGGCVSGIPGHNAAMKVFELEGVR